MHYYSIQTVLIFRDIVVDLSERIEIPPSVGTIYSGSPKKGDGRIICMMYVYKDVFPGLDTAVCMYLVLYIHGDPACTTAHIGRLEIQR